MNEIRIASPGTMLLLLESIDLNITKIKAQIDKSITHREKAMLGRKQAELENTSNSIFEVMQRAQNID